MSISLTNKKNTKLTTLGDVLALSHYGSETCRLDSIAGTVTISLCGWDTVTTRGKINLFLRHNGVFDIVLTRDNNETMLTRRSRPDVPLAPKDTITIRLSDLHILQDA